MTTKAYSRVGSLQLVQLSRVFRFGAFYVAATRIRTMWQWKWSILGEAIVNPMFYLLSIGIGIGKFVNAHQNHGVDGVKYLTFLAPALLASACIVGAVNEVMFPTLEGFKWNKNFYAIYSTPISSNQIADGILISAMARAILGTVFYYCALLAFGGVSGIHSLWLLLSTLLYALSFASLMMGICAAVENSDLLMNFVNRLLIMPLFLFSGTFYSLTTMPFFLQWIGWLSPLWHATEVGREISYGHHVSLVFNLFHLIYFAVMLVFGVKHSRFRFAKRLSK